MYVVFKLRGENVDKIMACFYNRTDEQRDLMNRSDVDKQVKEWQKNHMGQPPIFESRVIIKEFISDAEAYRRNIKF